MVVKASLPPAELLIPVVDGKEAAGGAAKEKLAKAFPLAAGGATLIEAKALPPAPPVDGVAGVAGVLQGREGRRELVRASIQQHC
jgi:hypothetical protein